MKQQRMGKERSKMEGEKKGKIKKQKKRGGQKE